jgi:hypothetical protein
MIFRHTYSELVLTEHSQGSRALRINKIDCPMIIPLSYYTLPYFGLILDGCCSWTVSSCFMSWIFLDIFRKKTDGMKFIIQDWIWLYDIVQQRRTLPLGNDDQMCILMGTTMSSPPCHQVIVFNIHIQRRQALWPVGGPKAPNLCLGWRRASFDWDWPKNKDFTRKFGIQTAKMMV